MNYNVVSIIADISLALSFIVALVFGIFQVRDAARDRKERRTIEALRNFQSREFAELSGKLSYQRCQPALKSLSSFRLLNKRNSSSLGRKWNRSVSWLLIN